MYRCPILTIVLLVCSATAAEAQTVRRSIDPVFVRAQALVSDGNGAAGRALIDSVISVTPAGAPLYPQALYWRASLASNAADAESDYRHIVVDYPLAPQAEDALLRLAQLELARGDKDGALVHLQRIQRDYPRSKSLARASYWTARVLFEKNDMPNACAANARALAQTDSAEVELRNQIQYQGQRCPAAVAASPAPTQPAPGTPGSGVAVQTASVVPVTPTTISPPITAPTGANAPAQTIPAAASSPAAELERVRPEVEKPRAESDRDRPVEPVASKNAAMRAPVVPAPAAPAAATPAAAKSGRSSEPAKVAAPIAYSVQVAAYTHREDAEKLVVTLTQRGYAARVDGSAAPFRVRIGRYSTNAEAEDALKKIKAKQMDGFVARVPTR